MDLTELILKFGWIGWKGNLEDVNSLLDWLYREYGICLEEQVKPLKSFKLSFQECTLCKYYGVEGKSEIISKILPDITLLWKCKGGKLSGPSFVNYEEPDIEWD